MSRSSRDKGARGEREVAAILRAQGFRAVRVPNSGGLHAVGRGDLIGIPGVHLEVKRCERAQLWEWLAQLERDCPPLDLPVLAFRRSRSEWWAALPLDELAALLALRERA